MTRLSRGMGFEVRAKTMLEGAAELAEGPYKNALDLLVKLGAVTGAHPIRRPPETLGQKLDYVRRYCPCHWQGVLIREYVDIRNSVKHRTYEVNLKTGTIVLYRDSGRSSVLRSFGKAEFSRYLRRMATDTLAPFLATMLRMLDNTAVILRVVQEVGFDKFAQLSGDDLTVVLGLAPSVNALRASGWQTVDSRLPDWLALPAQLPVTRSN